MHSCVKFVSFENQNSTEKQSKPAVEVCFVYDLGQVYTVKHGVVVYGEAASEL